jgi:AcrR family transcriptional regulator
MRMASELSSEATSFTPVRASTSLLSRRERKRVEVRDRLYAAAVALFTEQGFEETTMEAIGERADVARATVFNHYAQKVTFLEEWGRRRREHVLQVMGANELGPEPAAATLRRFLQELAQLNVADRRQAVVLMNASWRFGAVLQDPGLGGELAKIIASGQRQGEIRDVDAGQVGAVLAAAYFSTVLRWTSVEPTPFSLLEHIEGVLEIVLGGILAGP